MVLHDAQRCMRGRDNDACGISWPSKIYSIGFKELNEAIEMSTCHLEAALSSKFAASATTVISAEAAIMSFFVTVQGVRHMSDFSRLSDAVVLVNKGASIQYVKDQLEAMGA